MTELKAQVIDVAGAPWERLLSSVDDSHYGMKSIIQDAETGVELFGIRYEAGEKTPWHRHNCSHGIYVLEGTLYTSIGNFGPGNFVWFPEGIVAEHGATADGPVSTLFFTNKKFDIERVQD